MKIIFTLLLLFGNYVLSNAQTTLTWQKTFGGADHEYITKTIPLAGGGFAFTGHSESNNGDVSGNHGNDDLWVACADATGSLLWSYLYGGSEDDQGYDIIQTSDGGFLVIGLTESSDGNVIGHHGTYNDDLWILRLNAAGQLIRQKCFGGTNNDDGAAIADAGLAYFYAGGSTYSNDGDVIGNHSTGESDTWIIKIDTLLNLVQQKCVGGTDYEELMDIKKTSDNGCIITGRTYSSDGDVVGYHAGSDLLLAKLTSALTVEWAKAFGGSQTEEGNSVVQLSDGSYAALGYTSTQDNGDVTGHHPPQGMDDFWLIKVNTTGTLTSAKCYGGSGDDQANGLVATFDGGFAMCGLTNSNDGDVSGFHTGVFAPDVWVAKVNAAGNMLWQRCCGGSDQDESFRIYEENTGVLVVSAFTYSTDYDVTFNHGNADGWILKVSAQSAINHNQNYENFNVFYNREIEMLEISGDFEGILEIADSKGSIILNKTLKGKDCVDLTELSTGVYLINIRNRKGNKTFSTKFLK